MKQSQKPLWKKSIIQNLNLYDIQSWLDEIGDNGDMYGYDMEGESEYFYEYKELFDELSAGAYSLYEALSECEIQENWDDMVVALLGETHKVLGFDAVEMDYFGMLNDFEEEIATDEAIKRIKHLTKDEMIRVFQKVVKVLLLFFDIKASHDCLTAVVEELDNRGALLQEKNRQVNQLYEDLTGKNGEAFDIMIQNIPQRMWIE